MSITSTDIVAYAAANMPEDESSTAGGAIDPLTRVVFTDLAVNDSVEVLSSSAGDTVPKITVWGRKASGLYTSQQVTLNGTTPVALSSLGTIERVQKAQLDSDCVGTITVRRSAAGPTVSTIPPAERGFIRLFINSFSDPSAPKIYYTKFFWKNNHATLALLTAIIKQNADPSALITHALEDAYNDSHTVANRITAPATHVTAFNDTDKAVAATDLTPTDAQGVWLKMSLATNNAAVKSTYTSEIDGSST